MNPGMVFEGTSQRGRVLELYDLDAVANHVSGDAAEKLANQTLFKVVRFYVLRDLSLLHVFNVANGNNQ